MRNDILHFTISIPTDEGFIGRECNNPNCKRYFKVHTSSLKNEMYCPYCGEKFSNDQLWTEDQNQYIKEFAEEKAREFVHKEFSNIFNGLSRRIPRSKHVAFTYKSEPYKARSIEPRYHEHQVDSELTCPNCSFRFQVFGIFGYCPGCQSQNLLIYDANLEIIKQEISSSDDQTRALRHAYSDLVSTFESFCKRKARAITQETTRFQELFEARKFFKDLLNIDILGEITQDNLLALRRVFQKRHAHEHSQGIIEEKYIKKIPEDAHLLGQKAVLSLDEFTQASQALRKVLDKLVLAISS